ncbi:MAG: thimet oligopeptidase [Halioglobus sp.]
MREHSGRTITFSSRRTLLVSVLLCFALGVNAENESIPMDVDGRNFNLPAKELTALCEDALTQAQNAFTTIENDTRVATLDTIWRPHDEMYIGLQRIQHVWYLKSIHPETSIQAAAEKCINDFSSFATSVDLSQKFYQRVASIDLEKLNSTEQLMVERRLRDFRKAGVDKDEATRERVRELISEITELGSEFDKNIRSDKRYVDTTPTALVGLPQDYIDEHPVDENGLIRISTSYPDYFPAMKYSADDELRKQLFIAAKNIATPDNEKVLKQLIAKRYELARLLGYPNHAASAMDSLMIGSPQSAQNFLQRVGKQVKKPAARDRDILLHRLHEIEPKAKRVEAWQTSYLFNQVQQEKYALDSREIRTYFHFNRVQAGIFQLTKDLFGVEIVPWVTDTWHEDVTTWEIREGGKVIGRFYLDMHPREDKYKHAAHWTLRTGLKDRQVPISGMATNFPKALMEHGQVTTFLHEFGHLLHNVFSGTQEWLDISGMSMERDFVEAPSQMLEEWAWDYDTLRLFAVNNQGESIPKKLVAKMNRARNFGEAVGTSTQIFYATLALNYYNREPASFDLLPLLKELQLEYGSYPYVEGTHFYNNFGHLNGYSSNYYMYQWSKAISTDLLSGFTRSGLRSKATASAYREKVLAPGGSKPAAQLIEDFLGRPFTLETYGDHLDQLN